MDIVITVVAAGILVLALIAATRKTKASKSGTAGGSEFGRGDRDQHAK